MPRSEDIEHILVVEIDDDEPMYTIEHPPGCPRVEREFGEFAYTDYECMTGAFITEAGSDAIADRPLNPGRFRVQAWYEGPGWAGSYPIEPEGWIDVLGVA